MSDTIDPQPMATVISIVYVRAIFKNEHISLFYIFKNTKSTK